MSIVELMFYCFYSGEGSKSSQAHVKPINPPPVQKKPAPYKPRHAKVTAAKETE
ncbi:hypothetical protein Tco_0482461, partial [Tanacetum coccineum]